ncbi:MAG: TetR/AcrR family transcriptional regulator, partial [Actinomycetota bacterium]|nr:TetR/AcrR family transcriptional regulator [Actinomycetota bacterium]
MDVSAGAGGGALRGTAAAAASDLSVRPGSPSVPSVVRRDRPSGDPAVGLDLPPEQRQTALTRDGRRPKSTERDRIIAATLDVVATIGFTQAKVGDIIATARVARRTFWSHFSDKAAALTAAYEQITDELRATVQQAHDDEPDPARRITACLAAIAAFLADDPARAEVLLVQAPAAGRDVVEIRTETMRRLAELLARTVAELAPCPIGSPDRSQIVIESLAGGLYEVAFTRTVAGNVRDLPS